MTEPELFRLVMDNAPNLIFVKDQDSVVLYANKAVLALLPPERRDRIVDSTMVEDVSAAEADLFLAEDRRALAEGSREVVEEIVGADGETHIFHTRKLVFQTMAGERRLLGISNDITELVHRERRLAELNDHLQSFSALAAHDLRSPLCSFVSAMQIIKRDPRTVLSPRSEGIGDAVAASATNLADAIGSLLTATKHEFGAAHLSVECYNLNLLLAEVRFNLSHTIAQGRARIYATRLPHACVEVRLFRQLLQNLVENGIKYRASGTDPEIILRCQENDDDFVFTLEDNGRGIGARATARMFDLYKQDSGRGINGVGLGLSLCKKIVALHGGDIWIDEAYRNGCRIV